ncbi:hypothetical protein ACHAQA_006898 [Verticillium albo-atrum]
MSAKLPAFQGSDASTVSTALSSVSGIGEQPLSSIPDPLKDTRAETRWPDSTNHERIERIAAEGAGREAKAVIMPNAAFQFKGQTYNLLVGFVARGTMHIWRLHREVVYPRCYAIKFHGKQDLLRKYDRGLSKYSTAPVVVVVVIPNIWAPLDVKHIDHMFNFMYKDPAPTVLTSPLFCLQDILTGIKLGHWLNDTFFRSYERAMGAFLNERLAAWLESYPEAPQGPKCSSEDVAIVFARLAAKPWYREMPFGACIEELRILLEKKHELLLKDAVWARLAEEVPDLGIFMGMDLIQF